MAKGVWSETRMECVNAILKVMNRGKEKESEIIDSVAKKGYKRSFVKNCIKALVEAGDISIEPKGSHIRNTMSIEETAKKWGWKHITNRREYLTILPVEKSERIITRGTIEIQKKVPNKSVIEEIYRRYKVPKLDNMVSIYKFVKHLNKNGYKAKFVTSEVFIYDNKPFGVGKTNVKI